MPLLITVSDIQLVTLNISSSGSGASLALNFDADWQSLDALGQTIDFVEQKKSTETRLFSEFPQEVQDAVVALNNYATNRIKTAEGI